MKAPALISSLLLTAAVVSCGAADGNPYAAQFVQRAVFGGVEIGMLRPQAVRRAGLHFQNLECSFRGHSIEECVGDGNADWPGAVLIEIEDGVAVEMLLLLDSTWVGVTPDAVARRIAGGESIPPWTETSSGNLALLWVSRSGGAQAGLLCADREEITSCAVVAGVWSPPEP